MSRGAGWRLSGNRVTGAEHMNADFVERLVQICGPDYVLHSSEAIELYSRCTIPWSRSCGAVVFPDGVDQICGLVRLCNEFRIPLWAFSRGHNWGYGTVLALQEGALIVILERMNRILEVNEELGYAVIEPGVSQGQLNQYLKGRNINLWIDCTDSSPDGSLIGNALDRGVGYTPYGDHFANLCGMEVVLGNGEVISTGGVSEQCPTRYTYKWGVGPFVDGLFAQSSLGVVTKAGLWLMPKPDVFEMFVIKVSEPGNLAPVINALRDLALQRIVSNCHGFNAFLVLARISDSRMGLSDEKKFLSTAEVEKWGEENGLAAWTFIGGVYGTAQQVRANKTAIKKYVSSLGEVVFIGDTGHKFLNWLVQGPSMSGLRYLFYRGLRVLYHLIDPKTSVEILESLLSVYPILKGEPNESILTAAYFKNRGRQPANNLDPKRDECGLIFFAPMLPASGNQVRSFVDNIERICNANRFETGVLLIQENPRTFFVVVLLIYDKKNPEEAQRAQGTYDQLCELLEPHNYQQYRCTTPHMQKVLEYNPSYQRLVRTIKQALDPNGVIAPGRYGA